MAASGGLRRFLIRHRVVLFCFAALAPVMALFLYVRIIPIGFGVWLSFHKWNMLSPAKPFIGLTNYELLLEDENFHLALYNTTVYSFATVLLRSSIPEQCIKGSRVRTNCGLARMPRRSAPRV